MCVYVCVCVRACVRACVRVEVRLQVCLALEKDPQPMLVCPVLENPRAALLPASFETAVNALCNLCIYT